MLRTSKQDKNTIKHKGISTDKFRFSNFCQRLSKKVLFIEQMFEIKRKDFGIHVICSETFAYTLIILWKNKYRCIFYRLNMATVLIKTSRFIQVWYLRFQTKHRHFEKVKGEIFHFTRLLLLIPIKYLHQILTLFTKQFLNKICYKKVFNSEENGFQT